MKAIVLGHPGAFGDIIICAPIAKEYSTRGYKVYWPVGVEHLSLVEGFSYVHPIPLPSIKLIQYDNENESIYSSRVLMGQDIAKQMGVEYLNLGDRFVTPDNPYPTPLLDGETVEEKKYRVAGVDFCNKHKLEWTRDTGKEDALFELVVKDEEYVFAHLNQSDGTDSSFPFESAETVVEGLPVENYNILDWYKVIINAQSVYCIESSFQCFIDGLGTQIQNKYLLSTKENKITTTATGWDTKYL
jgi:hypothetical protein